MEDADPVSDTAVEEADALEEADPVSAMVAEEAVVDPVSATVAEDVVADPMPATVAEEADVSLNSSVEAAPPAPAVSVAQPEGEAACTATAEPVDATPRSGSPRHVTLPPITSVSLPPLTTIGSRERPSIMDESSPAAKMRMLKKKEMAKNYGCPVTSPPRSRPSPPSRETSYRALTPRAMTPVWDQPRESSRAWTPRILTPAWSPSPNYDHASPRGERWGAARRLPMSGEPSPRRSPRLSPVPPPAAAPASVAAVAKARAGEEIESDASIFRPYSRVLRKYLRRNNEDDEKRLQLGLAGERKISRDDGDTVTARAALRQATRTLEETRAEEIAKKLRDGNRKTMKANREHAITFMGDLVPRSAIRNKHVWTRYDEGQGRLTDEDLDWLGTWRQSNLAGHVTNLNLPDFHGRLEILQGIAGQATVDDAALVLPYVAACTDGYSGARLATLVNEAVVESMRDGDSAVRSAHFETAMNRSSVEGESKSQAVARGAAGIAQQLLSGEHSDAELAELRAMLVALVQNAPTGETVHISQVQVSHMSSGTKAL